MKEGRKRREDLNDLCRGLGLGWDGLGWLGMNALRVFGDKVRWEEVNAKGEDTE